ncbi:MAG: phosphomannomutase/phosphoglucomutase [Thermodesulfovibrionales bacterium]|nr:phosphomannomutase/phosphoglucomutase [Thermodesulfovibrionales bacterium]
MINDNIFREYDIRGVAGKELNRDVAFLIGRAFGLFLDSKFITHRSKLKVSVGRDVRLSSEELSDGVIEGIVSTGIDVVDIGVCPTPLQYFSIFHLDLDGGIMITGSHNPPEYNGFKISIGKEAIHGENIKRLREIIEKGTKAETEIKGRVENYDIVSAYKSDMLKEFSYLNNQKYRPVKVVVDAGNGTAGIVAPEILSSIGCDVIPLYCEPDGNFPNHHPDPTVVECIQDLIAKVKNSGSDIGIGYDGDADRIGVIDRDGNIVWGDQLMIILSRELRKEKTGAKIIGDVKCSQLMFDDILKHGGVPIMCKTGHSLVKQRMKEEGALLAGEFSGHIFIKDRYFGYDDAIYTTLRLVEIMKLTGKDIKGLLSGIPKMSFTPEIRIECSDDKKKALVKQIVEKFIRYKEEKNSPCIIKDLDVTDGVRIVFEKGWGLIRASNTQPVIVMRVEAEDEESLDKYKMFLEDELGQEEAKVI